MITGLMQIWCYSNDIYKTFNAALPQGLKNQTVKIEKICANGIKFESDSHFDERGNLTWTYKKNNSVDYYFQNDIFW